MSAPPRVFAALNGKYKYAALHDIIKEAGVELRIGLVTGRSLDPYYLPLLEDRAVVYCMHETEQMYQGCDVVLSYTASQAGMFGQLKAIRLAAAAGVKLFVPCEYTLEFDDVETSPHIPGKELKPEDMENEKYPLVKLRREAIDLCAELGLPCLRVVTGIVPENFITKEARHPYIDEASSYGWDLENKSVEIVGSGDVPITFTPKPYYRAWITNLLTTTPLNELQKMGTVYLGGETLTQNQIVSMWEKKHGAKLQVKHSDDVPAREERIKKDRVHNYWTQWPEFIQVQCAKGKGKLSKETTPTSFKGKKTTVEEIL